MKLDAWFTKSAVDMYSFLLPRDGVFSGDDLAKAIEENYCKSPTRDAVCENVRSYVLSLKRVRGNDFVKVKE